MSAGRAVRAQQWVAAQPVAARTVEDEERAGYAAGESIRRAVDGLSTADRDATLTEIKDAAASPDAATAARSRGMLRALTAGMVRS